MAILSSNSDNQSDRLSNDSKHELLASWSNNTTSSFNGQTLSIEGSLGFDGLDLFRESHIILERGSIYGLVAPNGSGKTSLVRALPHCNLDSTKHKFSFEYLSADIDSNVNDEVPSLLTARKFCLKRIQMRVNQIETEIESFENELEAASEEAEIEEISSRLGDAYDLKDNLLQEAESRCDQMLEELNFGKYAQMSFSQLSSGWKYKCQLLSALLTRPDCFAIDEPSFLDTKATQWLVEQIQDLSKSNLSMVVLISHKEALMEEVCDRILHLNPTSKTLSVYNCSYREFRTAHFDRVSHAKKTKEQTDKEHSQAKTSLQNLKKQLKSKERNLKAITSQNSDQRFIKGKNKEAKQKADHSAASKVKRLQKKAAEMEELEEELRETKIPPLELNGAEGNDRPIVELQDVQFSYEHSEDLLLRDIFAQISGHDKVLLQAANGEGKSTLAKIIIGTLEPTGGDIRRHRGVIAHFHQDALLELITRYGNATAVEFLLTKDSSISSVEARNYLGRFGLKGKIATRHIKTLSSGQRVRLWLAREFWGEKKPSLLVLDEVTENLDKETTDSLLSSLDCFTAAILAISHDEYFCENFKATQHWRLCNGRLQSLFQ